MDSTTKDPERLSREAEFQDARMRHALEGELEFRDKFYFINRSANETYEAMHAGLAGKRVVVVGSSDCGVTPLARKGVYAEGIDISPVSIEKLNRAIDNEGLRKFGSARVMDAHALDYSDRSIDAITCSGVLHHLDTEAALRSWSRVLKSDGAVLMFEPLAFHPLAALFRMVTPSMRTPDEHPLRQRDFAIMDKYFGKVERRDFGLFTPISAAIAVLPAGGKVARFVLPALEKLDVISLKVLPFLRHLCWLTVVRLEQPRMPARA
jgi:ubiquinone/menaquinone biosynthesis C-methylase UbiE